MRENKIGPNQRLKADKVLRDICLECGMSSIRAWWVFKGLRLGGAKSARPDLLTAP